MYDRPVLKHDMFGTPMEFKIKRKFCFDFGV